MKRIVIGSDRVGFPLKESIREHLVAKGFEVEDVGNVSPDQNRLYYEVAAELAAKIASGEYRRGILVCGTGMGMSIVANKFKGVYAGVVESGYCAKMAYAVNRVNVLTMGSNVIGAKNAVEAVERWLGAEFLDGVADERKAFIAEAFEKVRELEEGLFARGLGEGAVAE
jgi:ribose 5-phosphate isomerase B